MLLGERVDTGGSSLAAAVDATSTAVLLVATDSGRRPWGKDAPFLIDVGDETAVEVTEVAGDFSPQLFAVVRTAPVPHPAGTPVRLHR